jgi:hypothetical protein
LKEQLCLLSDYADIYDQGRTAHAKSIATRIYAIMEMFQSKDGSVFVAGEKNMLTSDHFKPLPHAKTHGHHPLVTLSVSQIIGSQKTEARFDARLDNLSFPTQRTLVSISKWQDQIVLQAKNGKGISRKFLYNVMRNKDGGAHAPSSVNTDYAEVGNPRGIGLYAFGIEGVVPYDPPAHFATIRQMAHEIMTSPKLRATTTG